ncbi:MAG: MucR family transcriptional regulator [Arachnia sp.]
MAYRCQEDAVPGGQLCRAHQHRLDRGGGLPTAAETLPGDPSGHGVFGVIDRNNTGVLCHECGQRFARLGNHLRRAHQMNATLYRQRHGLPAAESLSMPPSPDGLPQSKLHPCSRCHTEFTTPGRLCPTCRQHKNERKRQRQLEAESKKPQWRTLTTTEEKELLTAPVDELSDLIERLQQDRIPSKAIGGVLGRDPVWMSRHHPRPGWGNKQ